VPTESTTLSGQSVQGQVYVVQQGDTLYSIARTHGVSVDAIKQANGLTSDEIYIGQQLIIPAP
jgi:LysM repeat protein